MKLHDLDRLTALNLVYGKCVLMLKSALLFFDGANKQKEILTHERDENS